MPNTEFTQADLDSLGAKLATLDLSQSEQAVLSALIAIATDAIDQASRRQASALASDTPSVVEHEDELPDLRQQLAAAFSPAPPAGGAVTKVVWSSVGGGTVALGHPTPTPPPE